MNNINYRNVNLNKGYWKDKQLLNENVTINSVYDRFYDTGRIEAFKFEYKEGDDKRPHFFWDSDIAKWIEGAAYILNNKSDKELENKIDYIVDLIEKNQLDDGYFNIYFTVVEPGKRFTNRDCHELYCAGHLMEAAVAYFEATGKDKFLKCMEKYAECIEREFMINKTAKFITPGHEEIELALVKMYRCTNNRKYLDMAKFFIDNRGVGSDVEDFIKCFNEKYAQNHLPVREQKTAEGHAVRACYLYSGMCDVAYETKDQELYAACKEIFNDIVTKKMYITGGLGSSHIGESFTMAYDLPNETAYCETCASISMIYFANRMMKFDNNSIYADIIERELYNGALAGVSLDGKSFFYENPLEINLNNHIHNTSTKDKDRLPITQRLEVFDCSCCPPNITRLLASLGDYIYSEDNEVIYINQFIDSKLKKDNKKVIIETNYPQDGLVKIRKENVDTIAIRIPSWCNHFEINSEYELRNGYAYISSNKEIVINFEMKPLLIESNSLVRNNANKVAIQYGPFVYCIESVDNCDNLYQLYIDKNIQYELEFDKFFNANVLKFKGYKKVTSDKLYDFVSNVYEDYIIKAIPYAGYANRGESNMLVWLNYKG